MEIKAFFLCDASNVRDNLLNVLSGGVTRVGRETYPAPLGVSLAAIVAIEHEELGIHNLTISLARLRDGAAGRQELLRLESVFDVGGERPEDGIPHQVSFALRLPDLPVLPEPGAYEVLLEVEGSTASTRFAAIKTPAGAGVEVRADSGAGSIQ
jgi:hypothetical protein